MCKNKQEHTWIHLNIEVDDVFISVLITPRAWERDGTKGKGNWGQSNWNDWSGRFYLIAFIARRLLSIVRGHICVIFDTRTITEFKSKKLFFFFFVFITYSFLSFFLFTMFQILAVCLFVLNDSISMRIHSSETYNFSEKKAEKASIAQRAPTTRLN